MLLVIVAFHIYLYVHVFFHLLVCILKVYFYLSLVSLLSLESNSLYVFTSMRVKLILIEVRV